MSKKQREIKKAIKDASEIAVDKHGKAIIDVEIHSKDDFFEHYCYGENKTLNPNMTEYIENCAKKIPANLELALHVHTQSTVPPQAKKEIQQAINREYANKFVLVNKALKANFFIAALLLLLGVGVLALAIHIGNINISNILADSIMIVAWVFLWEAVELIFFRRIDLLHKRRIIKHFLNCQLSITKNK